VVDTTRARWLIAGLVVAHVVLHAVALAVVPIHLPRIWFPYMVALVANRTPLMLGPSQGALLAVWVVFGGGRLAWRVLLTALGVFVYLRFFGGADPDWLIGTIGELGVCTAVLLVARLTGWTLVKSSDLTASQHPFQFYIRDILVWTTVLAMFLSVWRCQLIDTTGIWRATTGFCHLPINPPIDGAILAGLTIVAIASIVVALGTRWLPARILFLLLAIGIGARLIARTFGDPPPLTLEYATSLALMAVWLVSSLLVPRAAGYRLARRPEFVGHDLAKSQGD
jgi:hypothetical protein